MTSPYRDDPNAVLAARLAREAGGKSLAVYAAVRSTVRVPDALIGLGLPLLAYVLDTVDDEPVRVTALRAEHTAHNPVLGLGTAVDLWSVLVRFASEMTLTLDVAAGPWTTGQGPLEVRVEWMRSGQVTVFGPRGATIASASPGETSLGLTGIEERLLTYAEELYDLAADGALPPELDATRRIVEAARISASRGEPVELPRGQRSEAPPTAEVG